VPLAPPVIEIHEVLELALQLQLESLVLTETDPVPPEASKEVDFGEMLYVQGATPAWVTSNVLAAIVRVPVLSDVEELASTE
jgi:hypothetical protein